MERKLTKCRETSFPSVLPPACLCRGSAFAQPSFIPIFLASVLFSEVISLDVFSSLLMFGYCCDEASELDHSSSHPASLLYMMFPLKITNFFSSSHSCALCLLSIRSTVSDLVFLPSSLSTSWMGWTKEVSIFSLALIKACIALLSFIFRMRCPNTCPFYKATQQPLCYFESMN